MAAEQGLQRLAEAIGRTPDDLQGLAGLSQAQLDELQRGFATAQTYQRTALEKSIQDALGYLPALLRGPVIRILRG